MIHELVVKHKNTNKKLLLASNLWYNQPLVVYENLSLKQTPAPTQLILWKALFKTDGYGRKQKTPAL